MLDLRLDLRRPYTFPLTFLRSPPCLYEQAQSGLMEDGSLSQPSGCRGGPRDEGV